MSKPKTTRVLKRSVGAMTVLTFLLTPGCVGSVKQIRRPEELSGRLLAGRIEFFKNDEPTSCTDSGLRLMFWRDGDRKAKLLEPDQGCNVFIPVTEGRYFFGNVRRRSLTLGSGAILLDPLPTVEITASDSAVNFCVLEVRFYQGAGSKVAAAVTGFGWIRANVVQRKDCPATHATIASRFGGKGMSIRDAEIRYLKRIPY